MPIVPVPVASTEAEHVRGQSSTADRAARVSRGELERGLADRVDLVGLLGQRAAPQIAERLPDVELAR